MPLSGDNLRAFHPDYAQLVRDRPFDAGPILAQATAVWVKNAIDYVEETAKDSRVYLDGLPVGLIVTAYGWQATGSTLATMRSIVHALRGWPTPLGAAIRSTSGMFKDGQCSDDASRGQLELVGRQVVEFARLRKAAPSILETGPVEGE